VKSCRDAAQSDYWLALAKCDNLSILPRGLPEPGIGRSARRAADLQGTNDARQAACERLGGAAYDPVINPSNFVAQIDNPYFPLTRARPSSNEGQTAQGFEHDEFAVTPQYQGDPRRHLHRSPRYGHGGR